MDAAETSHEQVHLQDTGRRQCRAALPRHGFGEPSLSVLLFAVPLKTNNCAELSLTIGCHGDAWQRLMACEEKPQRRFAQKNYLFTLQGLYPHHCRTSCCLLC